MRYVPILSKGKFRFGSLLQAQPVVLELQQVPAQADLRGADIRIEDSPYYDSNKIHQRRAR